MYHFWRRGLFALPAETAHTAALQALKLWGRLPARLTTRNLPLLPVTWGSKTLSNPLGLAAGFDKDGRALRGLATLGFGFLEVGTVTPRAQPGNPRPRLFRLPAQEALINRMGFNNAGVDALVAHLKRHPSPIPIGVNIGKNRDTPVVRAIDDYRLAFAAVAPYADYVTINLSSPNTPGLRTLQEPQAARELLGALKEDQTTLWHTSGRYVPVVVKIAPDLAPEAVTALARVLRDIRCDTVIATNTTLSRPHLAQIPASREPGGLSGRPLRPLTLEIITLLFKELGDTIPIIGVGGIFDADTAWDFLVAGASLLQIYTGFVYEGPTLISTIITGLVARVRAGGFSDLPSALSATRRNLSSEFKPNDIKFT